jgi:hypothetical protein
MSENTQNDPQPTMWYIMRPQDGFEQIYQGKSVDIPIPLYPYQVNGALPLESERHRAGYEDHLAAYLQAARGATAMLLFPRIQGLVAADHSVVFRDYTYQLRWRQRPLDDAILSKGTRRYSTAELLSSLAVTRRLVIPCAQGKVIKPTYPTDGRIARGIFTDNSIRVIDQQGVYDDAQFVAWDTAFTPGLADNALGATGYPPEYVHCDGDELGLVLYRDPEVGQTWDFVDETTTDWPLTFTYGTRAGTHPINPGAGVWVCFMARATTP